MASSHNSSREETQRWIPERFILNRDPSLELDEFMVSPEGETIRASVLPDEEARKNSMAAHGRVSSALSSYGEGIEKRKGWHNRSMTFDDHVSQYHHKSISMSKPLPLEWYNFRNNSPVVGFDLELWWRRSPFSKRVIVFVALFLLIITFINIVAAIAFIVLDVLRHKKYSNLCQTNDCRDAGNRQENGLWGLAVGWLSSMFTNISYIQEKKGMPAVKVTLRHFMTRESICSLGDRIGGRNQLTDVCHITFPNSQKLASHLSYADK